MRLTAPILEGFVGSVLSKNFDEAVKSPECHREWWDLCCSEHRYIAISAPRGHAKSTAITFAYILAAVLFREHDFVVIVSDTEAQSILFLNDLKKEVVENEDIINLFGIQRLEKDAETDIIVRFTDGHRFRIMAKGSEQKLRGMKWRGKRPNLIVCDDIENDEVVMNPERREKFRKWVRGALLPILSRTGKFRIVGTILHMDSFLENLMPKMGSKTTVEDGLKTYSTRTTGFWEAVKYKAHNEDYSLILWPEAFSEERLKSIRAEYVEAGDSDVYNQEYLNYPIDETRAFFRREDFITAIEQEVSDINNGALLVHYFIGVDLAVSTDKKRDYTAFVIVGIDTHGKMYVVEIIKARMDALESVNTIFELQEKYTPEWFAIEKGSLEKAIAPFLREEMFQRNMFPSFISIAASVDKEARAQSIRGRVRVRGVKFAKENDWYTDFENELITFPRGKHDDQVDAFAMIGLALERLTYAPTQEEYEEAQYEEELKQSEFFEQGRSVITGY